MVLSRSVFIVYQLICELFLQDGCLEYRLVALVVVWTPVYCQCAKWLHFW